jgi:hypothetical protein
MFFIAGKKRIAEDRIKALGGEILTSSKFEPRCTHVVSARPATTEKFLCAVAAGKHILHPSYIEDSFEAGHFLPEEDYEWGTVIDTCDVKYDDFHRSLAKASEMWKPRKTRSNKGRKSSLGCENGNGSSSGCFEGVVALLLANEDKQLGLTRILEAGGGTVCGDYSAACKIAEEGESVSSLLPSDMQEDDDACITHVFVSKDFFGRCNGWSAQDLEAVRDVLDELSSQGAKFLFDDFVIDKLMYNIDFRLKSGKGFVVDVDEWLHSKAGGKRKADSCADEELRAKRAGSVANALRFLVPNWR